MGHVWEEERYMQGFAGANVKKETLGSPKCGWEDDIKVDFKSDICHPEMLYHI